MDYYETMKTLSDKERKLLNEELQQILKENTKEEIEVALCRITLKKHFSEMKKIEDKKLQPSC